MTINELLDAIRAWLQTGWSHISAGELGELTIGMAVFSLLLALIVLPFLYILVLETLNDILTIFSKYSVLALFLICIAYLLMLVSGLLVIWGCFELVGHDGQELIGVSLIVGGALLFWLGHKSDLKARHSSHTES